MSKVTFDITMSLDGFVAGPGQSPEAPLGEGGERLHEWMYGLRAWRSHVGLEGGETGVDGEIVAEATTGTGAVVMGRRMFGGGDGPWDESWRGWWGEEPPYHTPVFVLTSHPRRSLEMSGGTTFHFVTDGIESALAQAREAAGDRDVQIAGGATVVQQYLRAGLVDDFQVHVTPILLGAGARLFEHAVDGGPAALEIVRVVASPGVTHVKYRTLR